MTAEETARHSLDRADQFGRQTHDSIERAVEGIIFDLGDRRGLRQEWEMIDDDIQDEIRQVWREVLRQALR